MAGSGGGGEKHATAWFEAFVEPQHKQLGQSLFKVMGCLVALIQSI